MKIAGNCVRNPEKVALKLVICRPAVGRRRLGGRLVSFIDTTAMQDRDDWKKRAKHLRAKVLSK